MTFDLHYILEDINFDIKAKRIHLQDSLTTLSKYGFISLINAYTRIRNVSKTCIDHIFVKDKNNLPHYRNILHNDITDHFPIISLSEI